MWDDQGLWFTLVTSSGLSITFVIACFFLFAQNTSNILYLRLYRPNHIDMIPETDIFSPSVVKVKEGAQSSMFSFPDLSRLLCIGEKWFDSTSDVLEFDPRVDMLLFFSKLCMNILFFGGSLSVLWITVVCGTDDYLVSFDTKYDTFKCSTLDEEKCSNNIHCKFVPNSGSIINSTMYRREINSINETDGSHTTRPISSIYSILKDIYRAFHVLLLEENVEAGAVSSPVSEITDLSSPYTTYTNRTTLSVTIGNTSLDSLCLPVPINGIYDLSVQNISPYSQRNLVVAFLGLIFSIIYGFVMYRSLRSVTKYAKMVIRIQSTNSVGYRTILIKGIFDKFTKNEKALRDKYFTIEGIAKESSLFRHAEYDQPLLNKNTLTATSEPVIIMKKDCWLGFRKEIPVSKLTHLTGGLKGAPGSTQRTALPSITDLVICRKISNDFIKWRKKYNQAYRNLRDAVAKEHHYKQEYRKTGGPSNKYNDSFMSVRNNYIKPLECRIFPFLFKVPLVKTRTEQFRAVARKYNDVLARDKRKPPVPNGAVFVTFRTTQAALEYKEAFDEKYGGFLSFQKSHIAGPPQEINRSTIGHPKFLSNFLFALSMVGFVFLVFFWSIPIAFFGSISHLATLPGIGVVFEGFDNNFPLLIRNIIQAYLPLIVVIVLNIVLEIYVRVVVLMGGSHSKEDTDNCQSFLLFWFQFMYTVVLQAGLMGGLSQLSAIITDPTQETVFAFIIAIVSPQGGYWYATVIKAYVGLFSQVVLIIPLIISTVCSYYRSFSSQETYDALYRRNYWDFHLFFYWVMVQMGMGILFHLTVPLLGWFVGLFFALMYWSIRGAALDIYKPNLCPTTQQVSSFVLLITACRTLSVLYFISTVGTILTCSLKRNNIAVGVAIVSCIVAGIMMIFVFYESSKWRVSLDMVRSLGEQHPEMGEESTPVPGRFSVPLQQHATSNDKKKKDVKGRECERRSSILAHVNHKRESFHADHEVSQKVDIDNEIKTILEDNYTVYLHWHGDILVDTEAMGIPNTAVDPDIVEDSIIYEDDDTGDSRKVESGNTYSDYDGACSEDVC